MTRSPTPRKLENEHGHDLGSAELPKPGTPERLEAERKLVRKLDSRLLPTVVVIYIMNYIDRNGITTARLKGMQQDLGISDIQYATVIAVLYASYCPGQIPSNMLLNYLPSQRPSLYIGLCVVLWGLTSALTGVTKSFAGILLCRLFVGLPESAFYPGVSYLLSRWYTKKELAFRFAILYSGQLISNAFGALMAAGILENMEGKRGFRAWRCPLKGFQMAISDPLVLIFTLQTVAQILGLSFVNFFPTLTQTLGFSTTMSLLLAAPPWVFASIACCLTGWWWGVIAGFIIGLSTMSIPARYVAMFLMASGYAGFAMNLVWVSNAIARPPAKRAAAIGIVNGVGNLGNLIGSYTWKAEWGPQYHQSMIISLAALTFSTLLALVIRQMLINKNKQFTIDDNAASKDADRTRVEEAARLEGLTLQQAMERRKSYRYLY
ncbi:hypothetical protein J132_00102 [Termitomyces sp. J132]|nr:hypothetical protein J132_00102 [Termitomyces sp. J132]